MSHIHLKKTVNGSSLRVKNSKNSQSPEELLERVKRLSSDKLHANLHIPKKGPPVKKPEKHSGKPLKAKGRNKGILNGEKFTGKSKSLKKDLKMPNTKMKQVTPEYDQWHSEDKSSPMNSGEYLQVLQ